MLERVRISRHAKVINGIVKRLNRVGYVQIRVGIRWQEEHRLVVENIIGRLLDPKEVIHHIDFNKSNNKPSNLALFESQQAHAHWHRQLRQFGYTNPLISEIEKRRVCNLTNVTNI